MVRGVQGGRPEQDEATVEAVSRRGRNIQVRVIAYALSDGQRSTGVVLVMEEMKAPEESTQTA
jgi:hypothetical protein